MQVTSRYLKHHGVDDTKWYVHKYGKWQPQAKYAHGLYEDGSSYNNSTTSKETEKTIKKAQKDAKNDYYIQAADRGSIGAAVRLVSGKVAVMNLIAGPLPATVATSFMTTKAIKDYNKRHGDNASYINLGSKKRRTENAHKSIETRLSESTIKDMKLSDDYVKAYSEAMDSLVRNSLIKYNPTSKKQTYKESGDKFKDTLDKIGILAPTAGVTNVLTTAVTGGASLAGDVMNVAKPILKNKMVTIDKTTNLANLPKLDHVESKADALAAVNADANKGLISKLIRMRSNSNSPIGLSFGQRNCADCTAAYELRLRGYDVSASQYSRGHGFDWVKEVFPNAKTNTWGYASTVDKTKVSALDSNTINSIIKNLTNQGPNARGSITLAWKNQWGGHNMSYEVTGDGVLNLVDAQSGRVVTDVSGFLNNNVIGISTTRFDNLSLTSIPAVIRNYLA